MKLQQVISHDTLLEHKNLNERHYHNPSVKMYRFTIPVNGASFNSEWGDKNISLTIVFRM